MEHRYIGKSGLRVSPICMGTMSFGSWSDKKESFKILEESYERGINFFDTAEVYPVPPSAETVGVTEQIFGEWVQTKPRDSLIIATKVAGAAAGWFVPPIRHGLTALDRFHIEAAVEGSLRRMKIDYIDLYQVHWPDPIVPIDETMEALDRLVQAGKVRYTGTSNENAYGLTKANTVADYEGLARFQSIQNNFSLLNRRFLDELAQVCKS
ncbi:aldo/keto reductase, partial [Gammaproteobacteria bacterium]|nr:aldo/keto reductase [Gammaproteobacteria bacterium]